jgi:hypothetical protein
MKKIVFNVICLFIVTSLGYCQESSQSLQLIIDSDKQVYQVGEDIKITATLVNKTNKEQIVFWSKDKAVLMPDKNSVLIAIFPEKPWNDYNELNIEKLYIKPNASISKNVLVNSDLKNSKTKYKLTFKWKSPGLLLDFLIGPNQEIWSKTLLSNTIAFEVVDKNQ